MLLQGYIGKLHWYKQKGSLKFFHVNPIMEIMHVVCAKVMVEVGFDNKYQGMLSLSHMEDNVRNIHAISKLEGMYDCFPVPALADVIYLHFKWLGLPKDCFLSSEF